MPLQVHTTFLALWYAQCVDHDSRRYRIGAVLLAKRAATRSETLA